MSSRRLKVIGIDTITQHREGQWRYVAAVHSRKEFANLLGWNTTYYFVREYSSETANSEEVEVARANPHKLIAMHSTRTPYPRGEPAVIEQTPKEAER